MLVLNECLKVAVIAFAVSATVWQLIQFIDYIRYRCNNRRNKHNKSTN